MRQANKRGNVAPGGFSTTTAAQLSGLPYATADYWATSGFLRPSIAEAKGTGTARRYSWADVLAMRVAADLRRQGFSLQALRRVVAHLRHRTDDRASEHPLGVNFLVSDGRDVYEATGDELVSLLGRPGQGVFHVVIDLGRALRELVAACEGIAA